MIKHIELNNQSKILRGYLDLNTSDKLVIFYHGFTGNKSEHAYIFRDFSRVLSKNNISSLRMDYYGNGESNGSFKEFTFDSLVSDANCILNYALTIKKSIVVLGFSLGGALASLLSVTRKSDINSIIMWNPAGNIFHHIKTYYESSLKTINSFSKDGLFELSIEMVKSLDNYEIYKDIETYTKPVLIISGMEDKVVPFEVVNSFKNKYINSILYQMEGAGHGFDKASERELLYKLSLEFIRN